METFSLTVLLAFILVGIALFSLAIGWFFTGKSKIKLGMCGRVPNKKKGDAEGCGKEISCHICEGEGDDARKS